MNLQELAADFKYNLFGNDDHFRFEDIQSRVKLCLERTGKDTVFAYLYARTTSWDFGGERTDLNDALSVFSAVFLRMFETSCSLWDIPHPVEKVPETEIYARYLTIDQPNGSNYRLDEIGLKQLATCLAAIRTFENQFPQLLEWSEEDQPDGNEFSFDDPEIRTWAQRVATAIREPFDEEKIQYNLRRNPHWLYYRSIRRGISVYKAPGLARGLQRLMAKPSFWTTLHGINGTLYLSRTANNIISFRHSTFVKNVLRSLEGQDQAQEPVYVPLENYFVAAGNEAVLLIKHECGRKRFEEERERIRKRHQHESKVLFPVVEFRWNNQIDDDRFELLILDLLRNEPGVVWIRKVGDTNERDEGRDLICEWNTPPVPGQVMTDKKPPFIPRRVIIQCKASKKSVGKSKVQDIYDTIGYHTAGGYFLVVSSQLTTHLTKFLEGLRMKGEYWIDWWTRPEIEERLRSYPEIVARYSDIVQPRQ